MHKFYLKSILNLQFQQFCFVYKRCLVLQCIIKLKISHMKKIVLFAIFALFVSYSFAQKTTLITTAEFKKLVYNYDKNKSWKFEGKLPIIIDFYADWCAPCRKMSPILDELAKEYKGKVLFYKVNVDNEPELSAKYQVSSIPYFMIIPAKGQPTSQVGSMSKDAFKKIIKDVLKVK